MPAMRKISPNRRKLPADAAMNQYCQSAPIVSLACKLSRSVMDSAPYRALELVNAVKSLLGYLFEIIGNKEQMEIPAIIECSHELPHAIARIRFQYLDILYVPVCPSQEEQFAELRQVACRLKQPQIPGRGSLLNHETPDRRADSCRKHNRHPASEPYQGPSFQCRMPDRLSDEQLRMRSVEHERVEVCRIYTDGD